LPKRRYVHSKYQSLAIAPIWLRPAELALSQLHTHQRNRQNPLDWQPVSGGTTSAFLATGVPVGSSASGHAASASQLTAQGCLVSLDEAGIPCRCSPPCGTKLGISGGGVSSAATSVASTDRTRSGPKHRRHRLGLQLQRTRHAETPATRWNQFAHRHCNRYSGNVWIANSGNGSVTKVLGQATPTPLGNGSRRRTPATKP